MIVFSTFAHMQTFPSRDGKDSVTLPPRVRASVPDGFFDTASLPEGLRVVNPEPAPSKDTDGNSSSGAGTQASSSDSGTGSKNETSSTNSNGKKGA